MSSHSFVVRDKDSEFETRPNPTFGVPSDAGLIIMFNNLRGRGKTVVTSAS
jgi:hypothetical protein